jgi:hypothetical protein
VARSGGIAVFGQKILQQGEEEGSEAPVMKSDAGEVISFEEAGEECLGEGLGLSGFMALVSDVGVERRPINAAELLERTGGIGGQLVAGAEDDAPVCGVKGIRRGRVGIRLRGAHRQEWIAQAGCRCTNGVGSGKELRDDVTEDVGEAESAALVAVGEAFVVDAEEVEQGGVEIVHVYGVVQ